MMNPDQPEISGKHYFILCLIIIGTISATFFGLIMHNQYKMDKIAEQLNLIDVGG